MRFTIAVVAAALALVPAAGSAADAKLARATLKDAKGQDVGTATFHAANGGAELSVDAKGLPPGQHGIHVHAVGKCDAPNFKSAGPHFNPTGKKHGTKNPEGHHAGDLPNLTVGPDGKGTLRATLHGASLGSGEGSLLGGQGTAVVVHAGPDDEKTDPAGGSGDRIACGVVSAGK